MTRLCSQRQTTEPRCGYPVCAGWRAGGLAGWLALLTSILGSHPPAPRGWVCCYKTKKSSSSSSSSSSSLSCSKRFWLLCIAFYPSPHRGSTGGYPASTGGGWWVGGEEYSNRRGREDEAQRMASGAGWLVR